MIDLERLVEEIRSEHMSRMTERGRRRRSTWSGDDEVSDEDRQQHSEIGMRQVRDSDDAAPKAREVL